MSAFLKKTLVTVPVGALKNIVPRTIDQNRSELFLVEDCMNPYLRARRMFSAAAIISI